MSEKERSGFRDKRISERHRLYGWDCAITDIDFIACEYNHGKPLAIIDYKYRTDINNFSYDDKNANYKCLGILADGSSIPALIAIYNDKFDYRLIPINNIAKELITKDEIIPEIGYVTFLYTLRGMELPESVSNRIGTTFFDGVDDGDFWNKI